MEDRSHPVAITTFGRFGIEVGDTRSEAGNAVPYQFIKLLCIRGPVLSVDAVIDHIWPEADTATGRRRLKNLVSRARSILGADAIARNADFLSLEAHVRVDYEQFQDLSLIAFAPSSPLETATSAAWDALRIATGGLLPDDRFLTWADEPRWQADIAIQGLLRHLLLNESPGSAGRLLQAARRFDSTESTLLFDISRLALDADDRSVAIQAIDAARHLHAAADEPFVLPRDLERYLAD